MSDRILIRGATVLTQDDSLGEMGNADVLVEGDRIAEVGHGLSAEGARAITMTARSAQAGAGLRSGRGSS